MVDVTAALMAAGPERPPLRDPTPAEKSYRRAVWTLQARVKSNGRDLVGYRGTLKELGGEIRYASQREHLQRKRARKHLVFQSAGVQREQAFARTEARCCNLAYAYLRYRPYRLVEFATHEDPNWDRVAEIILRHGPEKDVRIVKQSLKSWHESMEARFTDDMRETFRSQMGDLSVPAAAS